MEVAVVSALHGVMSSLLGKLGDLLTAKYTLLKEAKGHIIFLKAELESMNVFLKNISDTEEPHEQDRCWAKEVRELCYDIEDSVSEFMLHVECESVKPRGIKGFIKRTTKLLTTMNIMRHDIAKDFEGLKIRVKEASERRTRYKMDNLAPKPNNTSINTRLLALHAETASLVGIKGPRDQLIQLMNEESVPAHQLKVISIVGFGGLGKTTLANEIYRNLEGKFRYRAFVSVSQKPNIRKILRTILTQAGFVAPKDTNIEMWEESELINAVQKFLLDKRYLIVIDDIWDASAWDIIRCALPDFKNGCRVITTTRIEAVARACCADHIECVYKMKALSNQDSRSLFFKRIFGSEDTCPAYLKEVSDEILKRCGGLPLAIITMSGMLANQPDKLKKEQWEYVRNSLAGSNFEMSRTLEGMRHILNLSYINLPHNLKTCILYLGIYPEDYIINKNELTRQWVAEGFICKGGGIDPEDIAKSYFNELINRNMIQPAGTYSNGEVKFCRVHDMMLDLILHKSREENFITVIDDMQDMTQHQEKIRRLSLNLDCAINNTSARSVQLSQTRTLARYGTSWQLLPFKLFKHLRILVFEISGCPQSEQLLDFTGICHLFHLRMLKIVTRYHVVLPSKMRDLQQLEVFEINAKNFSSKGTQSHKLPSDIVTLSRLFHLFVPSDVILPEGIGNMKSLRTLRGFDLGNSLDSIKGLRELTNLTNLKIVWSRLYYTKSRNEAAERCREVVRALENLGNLKYLHFLGNPLDVSGDEWCSAPVSFIHLQSLYVYSWFSRVPEWIGQLYSLFELRVTVREVLEDDVGLLAQLPSLILLHLHIKGAPKDRIFIHGGSGLFRVLKHFIVACSRISYLSFESGAMPMLERLELRFNTQGWDGLSSAPAGIEHLLGLKEICVEIGSDCANESYRKAAESGLRDVAGMHPGRPIANIKFFGGWYVFDGMYDEPNETEEEDGDAGSTSSSACW